MRKPLIKHTEIGKTIVGEFQTAVTKSETILSYKPHEPIDITDSRFVKLKEYLKESGIAAVWSPDGSIELTTEIVGDKLSEYIIESTKQITNTYYQILYDSTFIELIPGLYMLESDAVLITLSKDPEALAKLDEALRCVLSEKKAFIISTAAGGKGYFEQKFRKEE